MANMEPQSSFLQNFAMSSLRPDRLPLSDQLALFREVVSQNQTLTKILSDASDLELPEWCLASGCIFQTV